MVGHNTLDETTRRRRHECKTQSTDSDNTPMCSKKESHPIESRSIPELIIRYVSACLLVFPLLAVLSVGHALLILFGFHRDREVIIDHMETQEKAKAHKAKNYDKNKQTEHQAEEVSTEYGPFRDFERLHPGSVQPDVLDFALMKDVKTTLEGYMRRCEPVIIENWPGEMFGPLANKRETHAEEPKLLEMDLSLFLTENKVGPMLWEFVNKKCYGVLPFFPILHIIRFRGRYGGVVAHADALSSYNLYYVISGVKKVRVWPRQHMDKLRPVLKGGIDSYFVEEDAIDDSKLDEWYHLTPSLWEFHVKQGQALLFANSACLHKFENSTEAPDVFSIRLTGPQCCEAVAWHLIGHWRLAWHYALMSTDSYLMRRAIKRKPEYL